MTKDEIKNTPELVDFMLDESVIADSRMKLHKRLEELCKLANKALEQELIFEEIKAEALSLKINYTDFDRDAYRRGINDVLKIIDKYKTEVEPQERSE